MAGPNSAFKYDPAKAEEEARNKKQRELEKFKRLKKNKKQKKEKQEETQDQTFAEKVITQVSIVFFYTPYNPILLHEFFFNSYGSGTRLFHPWTQ